MKIEGWATEEGTLRFSDRFQGKFAKGHFRLSQNLRFSSIGIGTYLGEPDEITDALYQEALKESIRGGINVIDSAINYRCQRSERGIGRVLAELISKGGFARGEFIVCTKGGYLPFDGDYPEDPNRYFQKTYLDTGILDPKDFSQGCHAMSPTYLEDQLARSLDNLGLSTIDIYYLHNPETQLAQVSRRDFLNRLRIAFRFLEEKVAQGKIRMYGTATWSGYRVSKDSGDYLSLQEILTIAREAGGANHHFKVVQLPINLAMPEAWGYLNQGYGASSGSLLEVAQRLGITVIASASLLEGQLAHPFPASVKDLFVGLQKESQCALQFTRSLPGVVTALVGMRRREHVLENLQVASLSPMAEASLAQLFQRA